MQVKNKLLIIANALETQYQHDFNFRNHCYLRIAYDNAVGAKWDLQIQRPFAKYANAQLLEKAMLFLNNYAANKELLLQHNALSLQFRKRVDADFNANKLTLFD